MYAHVLISAALPELSRLSKSYSPRISAVTVDRGPRELMNLMTLFCAVCWVFLFRHLVRPAYQEEQE